LLARFPTDHDYAVSTREYQSDQPSQKLPYATFPVPIDGNNPRKLMGGPPRQPAGRRRYVSWSLSFAITAASNVLGFKAYLGTCVL